MKHVCQGADDLFQAIVYASVTATLYMRVTVRAFDGTIQHYNSLEESFVGAGDGIALTFTSPTNTPRVVKDGEVVNAFIATTSNPAEGAIFARMFIYREGRTGRAVPYDLLGEGYVTAKHTPTLDEVEDPAGGATFVFQGTVLEDATAGTHLSTLTVTPGAGNEMEFQYGQIGVGATATAQTAFGTIDDGTNILFRFLNPETTSNTQSVEQYIFPQISNTAALLGTNVDIGGSKAGWLVSGTMRLVLSVSTTAISVTQTFSVVCRVKRGFMPTTTLADSVGAPTLTTNTRAVF